MNKASEKLREITALLLFGAALFAFLATVSYTDAAGPVPGEVSNLCGTTGHHVARYMLYTFGYACYALYACVAAWAVVLFLRKTVESVPVKVLGLLAFTLFASALLSHFLAGTPEFIPDYGGLVGFYLDTLFTEKLGLGLVGTRITLVLLVLITFLLATDWLYYSSLAALASWAAKQRALHLQRRAARRRDRAAGGARPVPVFAGSGSGGEEEGVSAGNGKGGLPGLLEKAARGAAALRGEGDEEPEAEAPLPEGPAGTEPAEGRAEKERKGRKKKGKGKEKKKAAAPAGAGAWEDGDPTRYTPPPVEKCVNYSFPPLDLLDKPEPVSPTELQHMITRTTKKLENSLRSFKIDARVVEIQKGPVITMYEMELSPGIKVERIRSLDGDIAMAVKAQRVRIVAPIPGKSTVGIEVPNPIREVVRLRELLGSRNFKESRYALPICLGKDAAGRHLVEDLAKMPHLLVAGATGSGKSVCLNSIIMSILFTRSPAQTKMILIDPKMVELSSFKSIPHLMCPVVTDMKRAGAILEWAVNQMDERYQLLSRVGARNIYAYNRMGEAELRRLLGDHLDEESFSPVMPFVVIIVDELADLMMIGAKEIESYITRLAQKSRAVGIHLILATQRPSTNVITGLIKANMPTRIAFMVASKIDSRVILDANGAEKLLGQGDMLYIPPRTSNLVRAQGAFVSDEEIRRVTGFLKDVCGPVFEEDLLEKKPDAAFDPFSVDDLYEEAARFIIETQRGSASLLQRRFSIGYTRASRLIDLMAQDGVLGEYKGSQAREVLLTLEEWEDRLKSRQG